MLDLDFSNILTYPPAKYPGIVVLRLPNQAHVTVGAAIHRVLDLLPQDGSTPEPGRPTKCLLRTDLTS
jgi:hypothetical protein